MPGIKAWHILILWIIKVDVAVSFVNTKNGSALTLADMNTKIPFVLVILAIGGVGFILWKKRKETR